jgi:hypothetical protein
LIRGRLLFWEVAPFFSKVFQVKSTFHHENSFSFQDSLF